MLSEDYLGWVGCAQYLLGVHSKSHEAPCPDLGEVSDDRVSRIGTGRATGSLNGMMRRNILNGSARFIVPLTVVGILKFVGLLILHIYFSGPNGFVPPKVSVIGLADGYPTSFPDLYLLTNWDSGWYLLIARYGYSQISRSLPGVPSNYFLLTFNFFPGYPVAIRLLTLLLNDWVLSASIVSIAAGLCCVVVWQSISEDHLTRRDAIVSTLITFLFPPLFFMTTVAYSESLYLLMALVSWRFLTRDRLWKASVFAGLASIIRVDGLVVLAPVMWRAWKHRKWKDWAAILISLVPLASWLVFGYERTSRIFAFAYARSIGWGYAPTTVSLVSRLLAGKTTTSLLKTWPFLTAFDPVIIVTLAFAFGLFFYQATRTNKELGIYGFAQYLIVIVFGDWQSLLRYFGAIFPAWSVFWRRWRAPILILIAVSFYLGALYLWQQFLIGPRAP